MPRLPDDPAPYFQVHLFICINERPDDHPLGSCAGRGAMELRDYLKKRSREVNGREICVTATKCLSRCDKGPVVVIYPEGIWYAPQTIADADEIFETHLQKGGRVERLMIR
jgi:(2Fe-2S) ferredoxin